MRPTDPACCAMIDGPLDGNYCDSDPRDGSPGDGFTVLKAGIVGAGYIARSHADGYRAHPGVQLAYVADPVLPKAKELARQYGAGALATAAELIGSDVDLISVCTPTPTHADVAVAALAAGKNVLCEKPIGRFVADSQRIVDAARVAPGLLMVGHVSRFEPDHLAAMQLVAAGRIGRVRMMSQSITAAFPDWSQGGWFGDAQLSGGPLVDLAIHSFDYLTWVCGSTPVRVQAVGSRRPDGLTDYAVATVRYASGALAVVETSWAHPTSQGLSVATELTGTDGRINWDYDGIALGEMHTRKGLHRRFSPLGSRGFRAEIAAFVDAVANRASSPVPAEDALTALRVALAAAKSITTGRAVDLHVGTSGADI